MSHHHPASMHDAKQREPELHQHLIRTSAPYDRRYPAPLPHDTGIPSPWSSQHAFAPPKLPPPRTIPPPPSRASFADSSSAWNQAGHASEARARDPRAEHYDHRRSSQADAVDQLASEAAMRTRPHHAHSDPHYHYQTPSSMYQRPSEASAVHARHGTYERDQSRTSDHSSRMLADVRAAPLPSSRHSGNGSRDVGAQPYASAAYHDAHPDRFEPRRPDDSNLHQRVGSFSSTEPVDLNSRRSDAPTPAWSSLRPTSATKRSPPSQHEPIGDRHSATLPRVSYAAYGSAYAQESPLSVQGRGSFAHDRDVQERAAGVKPVLQRMPSDSDGFASTQSMGDPPHAHGAISDHAPAAAAMSAQHPMQPHRKRLRISRACDECRRRKTRCDIVGAFPGEPGHPLTISGAVPPLEPNMEPKGEMLILQPCMNCRRSEVTCSYSKRPLKRGPSKGYIKDLERRLNSLESQIVAGDRTEPEAHDQQPDGPATAVNGSAAVPQRAQKPKIRTEDRISRLESVFGRPLSTKDDRSDDGKMAPPDDRRLSDTSTAHIKSEASDDAHALQTATPESSADHHVARELKASPPQVDLAQAEVSHSPSGPTEPLVPTPKTRFERPSLSSKASSKGKGKAKIASARPGAPDSDIAEVKAKVVGSCLHATFPILPGRAISEGSNTGSSSNIARLEDRVLARGLRLLIEPVEMVSSQPGSRDGTPGQPASRAHSHAAKVANLIGQASAGLGGLRDELFERSQSSVDSLRALRKVAHRLSAQEADLLMLCHLDHLRNGRSNNSALAAAVSKLGSGSNVQGDRETYRRRTLLFMLDRWHAVAFGTPHLLTGRFGMERDSFRSMKQALDDGAASPLGDAVFEVLRCAIMLGQLNDLVQNNGGWKGVSKSDVDAVIHSAMDEHERMTATEATNSGSGAERGDGEGDGDGSVPDLLGTAAMRYSLESAVRCYYALHTLPTAREARIEDVQRMFEMAEAVIVLGTGKTPVSLQGRLLQSAVGPSVLAIAAIAFSWCLRVICMLVAAQSDEGATSKSAEAGSESYPLEFYRRKILDYVRMCGPFCLFSGGPPTAPASFAPVYLRLALYFNQTVSLAAQVGSLVSPEPLKQSPIRRDATALGNDADNIVDMASEIGALGYVLAATTQSEAFALLTGSSPT